MQIVFDDGDVSHELDVRVNSPSATVAHLLHAIGDAIDRPIACAGLLVGDRVISGHLGLTAAGLREGATVRRADHPSDAARGAGATPPPACGDGARELVVTGGIDAGRCFPLAPGTAIVGRDRGCDILLPHATVSRRHASLAAGSGGDVTVADLGSHNGTWLDGHRVTTPTRVALGATIRVGALELAVRRHRCGDRPAAPGPPDAAGPAGTVPFNRPPRTAPRGEPEAIRPPEPPRYDRGGGELSPGPPRHHPGGVGLPPAGVVTPLLFAIVMFAVLRSTQALLFAALAPLVAVAGALDGRRRSRRMARTDRRRFDRELADFHTRLAGLAATERHRRAVAHPDPAEIARRALQPSTALWERRSGDPDALVLRVGTGEVPWSPPVVTAPGGELPAGVRAVVGRHAMLRGAPVTVDLRAGVVGIAGDRSAALALARSLVCQAAVLHGPADLPVMVLAAPSAAPDWDWAKWLPHTRDPAGPQRRLSADRETSARLAASWLSAGTGATGPGTGRPAEPTTGPAPTRPPHGATLLTVLDDEGLGTGRHPSIRRLLRDGVVPVTGIVVASTPDRLPAACAAVIQLDGPDGRAELRLPGAGRRPARFLVSGMADDVARGCARAMARFDDPEIDAVGTGLPTAARLLPLLGPEPCTPDVLLARWAAAGDDPRPAGPIGVSERGTVTVDLVADGPHGLIAGTTGAGKSELLRTIVAGLAAGASPDHLTFLLVDFKGGSAFDACARLPHTVGMVTDLDEHLAARMLRCLEAELRHRERVLRAAGAGDLRDHRQRRPAEPLPRLVVVIDEFATLRAELPDFVDALVGVAQRGRSLGVHLLLATQRPQGAVSDDIRANTDLRIALRVQDAAESRDVIGAADAAAIPRTAPGRAYVRRGAGEPVAVQSALATGARGGTPLPPVDVAPFVFGPAPRAAGAGDGHGTPVGGAAGAGAGDGGDAAERAGDTDLSVIVAAAREAFAASGRPRPRRPWIEPLPGEVDLDALVDQAIATGGARSCVPLALADDPEAQAQYPVGWEPGDGNLIVYGIGGSGTTTALSSLALALARLHPPDDVHLYALDLGAGDLGALEPLPHVGAVILAAEHERRARLVRWLRAELDRRRNLGATGARHEPRLVLLLDGWSAFAAEYREPAGTAVIDAVARIVADGPAVRINTVITADRVAAVPGQLASLVHQRLALRLADAADYGTFGVRGGAAPRMVPGRALAASTGRVLQIARPAGGTAAAVARLAGTWPAPTRPPAPVGTLPDDVTLDLLCAPVGLDGRPWRIPVGVAERSLAPVHLVAHASEHVLITGPARSGRSTALLAVAAACRAGGGEVTVIAVAGRRSPLGGDPLVDRVIAPPAVASALPAALDRLLPGALDGRGHAGRDARSGSARVVVLVDDAESCDDPGGILEALAGSDEPRLLVAAAGRNDAIRTGYSHWTRSLRRARLGVALRPDVDLDGEMLGTRLPRHAPVAMTAGRGYLVSDGAVELVQVARPRPAQPARPAEPHEQR